MEWYWALALLLGSVFVLMGSGLPVAFAFFGANILGATIFFGGSAGLVQVIRNMNAELVNFSLAPVVMFILMGEILFHSGVALRAISAVERMVSRIPGRLAHVTVLGGTVFATLSGSSMANTAVLGNTLLPEMEHRGYDRGLAMGTIIGTGGIAMLIPPSSLAVLLGSLAGISIAEILVAAAIPGFLLCLTYLSYIATRCALNKELAPSYSLPPVGLAQRLVPLFRDVVPLFSLFIIIVGSILAGLATPTESASLGAIGAVLMTAVYGAFSLKALRISLIETVKVSAMIFLIIAASSTFSQLLAFSGATDGIIVLVGGLDPEPLILVSGMMAVVLLLGCIMDPVSIMLITLPFFIPLIELAQVDLVWFGVIMLLAIEIGQATPPFGLLLFIMKGVAPEGTTMSQIYRAAAPFIMLELIVLAGLIAFPEAVSWLPDLMRKG